jgi:molybdate transport system regulatory protein
MRTRVTLRLDFDDERRLGPGKVALLEAIARNGSISAAGREFGMSYRRAWLLVDELNRMFAQPVVAARGGGRNGGGAELTRLGAEIVARYRKAEATLKREAATEIRKIERLLSPTTALPKGAAT